ncbi:MAG: dTDP-4-dehydrorhamnose reductase [gamma proteobacterium symbiont of Taylorina sp.]|nr:dTDP-4-dehydrorhamnose reductase [gamma proteobacterium symbiont of Taylorina sp.]
MKILITGARGQVGTELVNQADHQVFDYGSKELDISDLDQLKVAVQHVNPHVIINAAAYTAVDKAETDQQLAYAVNSLGSKNLAQICKENNIPLLHISTDYIYDGEKKSPYNENDTPNPIGVYGASKLEGDEYIAQIWHKHIILRVSWVFGVHGNNFVKTMLRLAEQRDELSIVDDQFGAPTSAQAIAKVLLDIIETKQFNQPDFAWGLYNLQSDPGVSWFEFAREIFKQAQALGMIDKPMKLNAIPSSDFPTPVKRPANSKLDGNKLQQNFNISNADWQEDLQSMLIFINKQ